MASLPTCHCGSHALVLFYEALGDVLVYWREIKQLVNNTAKGEKLEEVRAALANPEHMAVLSAKCNFLAENTQPIITAMKSLESEEVLVCHVYSVMDSLESTLASQCLPEQQAFGIKTTILLDTMSFDVREKCVCVQPL